MKLLLATLALPLFLMAGCKTTPPDPKPADDAAAATATAAAATAAATPSQPERLSQQVARSTLDRAQQAYDAGDYAKTLATLKAGASVFDAAEPDTRLAAMKLEAFSDCVSNLMPECRAQFRKILDAFPSFDLSVAERKHPVWGPVFEAVKRQKR